MLTVRDLTENVELQGEIIIREYSHEQDKYIAEARLHTKEAERMMDKEIKYLYPLSENSFAIEVLADN